MPKRKLKPHSVRTTDEQWKQLELLSAAYGIEPADVTRRLYQHAIDTWAVPGLVPVPKPRSID